MRHLSLILFSILIVSCGDIKPQKASAYFSMDSLLDAQIEHLLANDFKLQKRAVANADTAKALISPDSLQWANEFEVLRGFDINKPALIGRYNLEEKPDPNSNLRLITYQAKSDELEVQQFDIYYLNQRDNIKWIKAKSREQNSIFSASKEVELEFDKSDGQWLLKHVLIKGYQKMILQDSVLFQVEGTILNSK